MRALNAHRSNSGSSAMKKLNTMLRSVVMGFLLTFLVTGSVCGADETEIVSKISGDKREFKIIKTEFSQNQSECTVTFASSVGIFAFNLDQSARNLSKLTLVIQDQLFCEGLTFRGKDHRETDLRTSKGVKITKAGRNIVIELSSEALNALKPGGQVQFVNQYR